MLGQSRSWRRGRGETGDGGRGGEGSGYGDLIQRVDQRSEDPTRAKLGPESLTVTLTWSASKVHELYRRCIVEVGRVGGERCVFV